MKYKIIVDKQSRINPTTEKREYEIDIEELRAKGDICDSLIIRLDSTYVNRCLTLSEYQVLTILKEPIKEPIQNISIEFFEGDNYIYLLDMEGNKFYAEYLIKNKNNEIFATRKEMNATIEIALEEIELSVNQKFTNYYTSEETNTIINMKTNEINQAVSKNTTDINNNYQDIIQKLGDKAQKDDVISLENKVETIQTNTDYAIKISEDIQTNGVSKVKTETGYTFDNDGLTIEKTNAKTKSKLNEAGLEITDATGSSEESLLFAGYDKNVGETVVKSKNMNVEKYLTVGRYSRIEDYEEGTGVFWIGG